MVRPGRDRLSGVVEVDEAFIGGARSGKRGRGAAGKSLVMIAAEAAGKKIGRIRMVRVADASAASLLPAIVQSVEPGTMIHTDGWRAYGGLKDLGYGHKAIRQTDELGENLLPKINLPVSLLKRWLLGTLQGAVRAHHLDYYLDEFTFRFNRRTSKSRGLLFYRLLQHAVVRDPVRGNDLVGGRALDHSNHTIEWPGE
jgi:transposase-like protein